MSSPLRSGNKRSKSETTSCWRRRPIALQDCVFMMGSHCKEILKHYDVLQPIRYAVVVAPTLRRAREPPFSHRIRDTGLLDGTPGRLCSANRSEPCPAASVESWCRRSSPVVCHASVRKSSSHRRLVKFDYGRTRIIQRGDEVRRRPNTVIANGVAAFPIFETKDNEVCFSGCGPNREIMQTCNGT